MRIQLQTKLPKYYIIFLGLFLIIGKVTFAQTNLVPNGSFEKLNSCTIYFDMLNKATGWKGYKFTPDILNRCASSDFLSVPKNTYGFEPASTGNGYAGILTYHYKYPSELIGVKLSKSLEKGQVYEVSFKVSLAEYHSRYATNNIGVWFTNTPEIAKDYQNPQINHREVITQYQGWTKITAYYKAEGDYEYLVLGNFFSDENTERKEMPFGEFDGCYYYIDDISVVKTDKDIAPDELITTNADTEEVNNNATPAPELKKYMSLNGKTYDAITKKPIVARVDFIYKENMKYNDFTESNLGTGSYEFERIAQAKRFVLQVKARNYFMITQNVENTNLVNLNKDFYLQPLVAGNKILLDNLEFQEGQEDITLEGEDELDKLIEVLNDNPTMRIEIIGSADNSEDKDLAKKRAEKIIEYLRNKGKIPSMRLSSSSRVEYTKEGDDASAEHKEEHKHRIRIEFKILN